MERLTMRLDDGRAVMRCEGCKEGWNGVAGEGCTAMYCRNMCKDRLAAYEDTGLEPEICAEYKKFEDEIVASGKTFNHLIELLRAEKEGRVMVVPGPDTHAVVQEKCRRWSEMNKQDAAAMLVQLYADYSTLCDKYGWPPSDGMSEAVAIAVQSLQEVE